MVRNAIGVGAPDANTSSKSFQQVCIWLKKSEENLDEFTKKRYDLVKGIGKYAKGGDSKAFVSERQKTFNKGYSTGFFYKLDDYLKEVKAPHFETMDEKVKYIREKHNKKVYKDSWGNVGVDERSMPTGALYKFDRGQEEELALEELVPFDGNNEKAEDSHFSLQEAR